MSKGSAITTSQCPLFFENWRASVQNGAPQDFKEGYECPLYTDAWIVGEETLGPYNFMNTMAFIGARSSGAAPAIVLRVGFHAHPEMRRMDKTDTSIYHGGTLSDEAAALAALALGARVEAGSTTREFDEGNPRGRPVAYFGHVAPVLPSGEDGPKLPGLTGRRSLEDLRWLGDVGFDAKPKDQIALIRSSRLYQEAIWVGDAEPALAWLLLVSAIETAANRWDRSKQSPIERLRDSKPALVEAVETRCPELLSLIADEVADSIGVTHKFIRFILEFLPPPPSVRPPEPAQTPWEPEFLSQTLKRIYAYRSKALHTGIPFPAPMCQVPMKLGSEWPAPAERPLGIAASVLNSVWLMEETPMYLHIFEYITRNILRAWWSSLFPVGA